MCNHSWLHEEYYEWLLQLEKIVRLRPEDKNEEKEKSCYLEPMPKQNHNHLWFKPNEILSLVKRRQQSEFPNPTQFEDTCLAAKSSFEQ